LPPIGAAAPPDEAFPGDGDADELGRRERRDEVIRLRRPSREEVDTRLRISDQPFSYPEVGATADLASLESVADDYDLDRNQFSLGTGRDLFERARSSLLAWRHFEIPWIEFQGAKAQVAAGQVVATLTRVFWLWFLNPCRVV